MGLGGYGVFVCGWFYLMWFVVGVWVWVGVVVVYGGLDWMVGFGVGCFVVLVLVLDLVWVVLLCCLVV